jgi:DNA-binding Xre family transcriptional regulator
MSKKVPNPSRAPEFRELAATLKGLLKERGLTYKALSQELNMSESGVKKILSGSDCSFERLNRICDILQIRLADLIHASEKQELRGLQFSKKQQEAFLKNPDLFHFFVKLIIERSPLDEIQKESQLSESKTFKYLRHLDDLKIIQLLPSNHIRIPPVSLVSDFGGGPLLEKTYREWGHRMVDEIAHPKNQASGQFIIRSLRMRDETYQEFIEQLRELEKTFAKRALREMTVSTKNLKLMRWMSLTDSQSFVQGPLSSQIAITNNDSRR